MDKFEQLLKNLSIQLDIELHVDENNVCVIFFDEKIKVQLELDENSENLIVFCLVSPLPPGKFRENVLLETLKANNDFPYIAIYSYYEKENSLAMHNYLHFSDINAEMLSSYLTTFVDLALLYEDAIAHGQTSPILRPI